MRPREWRPRGQQAAACLAPLSKGIFPGSFPSAAILLLFLLPPRPSVVRRFLGGRSGGPARHPFLFLCFQVFIPPSRLAFWRASYCDGGAKEAFASPFFE